MLRRSSRIGSSSGSSSSSSSCSAPMRNRPIDNSNVSTVSVSLPIVATSVSLPIVATSVSLPIVATSVSLPIAAGSSGNQLAETSVSTVSVSMPILAAPAISTVPVISLQLSAAPRQKRTRKSKPAPTIIFPVDIYTIQKSHNRDGNESENYYHTGDVKTDDSILEEESRLDADLAWYNQIRRDVTDRDTVQDSNSGESLVASSRSSSPPTNERLTSVTNIPAPQTQNESGYTDNRGRNSDHQNRRDNFNPQSHSRNSVLPNVPPQVTQSSAALPPGYTEFYANFYKQAVDNQFQNYNRNDNGNQRYDDYHNQANMRYNGNNYHGMENVCQGRQYYPQFYQSDCDQTNVNFQGNQHTNNLTSQNERGNSQQNPLPSSSPFHDLLVKQNWGEFQNPQGNQTHQSNQRSTTQLNPAPSTSRQARVQPSNTTPSSVEQPLNASRTPQILEETDFTRCERINANDRTILKPGATQSIILQVIANLKSQSHMYTHEEIVHHEYAPILLDRFQNLYFANAIARQECENWRSWDRAKFVAHLEMLIPLEKKTAMTFLEAVKAFHFEFDVFDETVEQHSFRALREIHETYTTRAEWENEESVKLLMEKINDPERINWHARFQKELLICDVVKPVANIQDFRTVLTQTLITVHEDIREFETVLRIRIRGSSRTRSGTITKTGKTEGEVPEKSSTSQLLCTVCGKRSHTASSCYIKDSPYANLTTHAYIGSNSHKKLQKKMGTHHMWIPRPTDTAESKQNIRKVDVSAPSGTSTKKQKPDTKKYRSNKEGCL